ncbi:MAG: 30S ribosomal protein S5 [Patescibacteria group bacterium]
MDNVKNEDSFQAEKIEKKVLQIDRVSRTVRGGRRIRFRALVAVGNHAGKVGIGVAKGPEVALAVEKATKIAQKQMIEVPIINGTIPQVMRINHGSVEIILKPAKEGTSIVAGGAIRTICELAGIKNIVGKILGTSNKINNSKALIFAFEKISKEK